LIIGPGDLYTSITPILLVSHVQSVIKASKAKIIYVMNLMTKSGQTTNYTAVDHLNDISQYLGKVPDTVIINNGKVPVSIMEWYSSHHEKLVVNNLQSAGYSGTVVEADLITHDEFIKSDSDALTRSILRHDSEQLTKVLLKIIV